MKQRETKQLSPGERVPPAPRASLPAPEGCPWCRTRRRAESCHQATHVLLSILHFSNRTHKSTVCPCNMFCRVLLPHVTATALDSTAAKGCCLRPALRAGGGAGRGRRRRRCCTDRRGEVSAAPVLPQHHPCRMIPSPLPWWLKQRAN